MTISIDAQKSFEKSQHSHMIKILQKMDIEGTDLNIAKAIYDNSKHYSQWWKTESIASTIRNKTRVSTFTTTMQHSFESPSYSNQRRKRKKHNPDFLKKEEIKLSLFADDMILHIENPINTIRKLLEIISVSKVTGYKINTQITCISIY